VNLLGTGGELAVNLLYVVVCHRPSCEVDHGRYMAAKFMRK